MSPGHQIISYFGETNVTRFPLILVIGREPNSELVVENSVDRYDFQAYPACAFWNTSYGMLARVVGIGTRDLKQLCVQRHSSPILYADSFPRGLPNHTIDKYSHRAKFPHEDTDAHVANIFSHRHLVDRVQLVIMSGLQDSVFSKARDAITQRCECESIPAIQLPFFYGTNTKKIQQALTEENRGIITSIFEQFIQPDNDPRVTIP